LHIVFSFAGFFKRLGNVAAVLLVLVSVFSVSSYNFSCTRWWWDPTSVWSIGCCQNPCAFKNWIIDYYCLLDYYN